MWIHPVKAMHGALDNNFLGLVKHGLAVVSIQRRESQGGSQQKSGFEKCFHGGFSVLFIIENRQNIPIIRILPH